MNACKLRTWSTRLDGSAVPFLCWRPGRILESHWSSVHVRRPWKQGSKVTEGSLMPWPSRSKSGPVKAAGLSFKLLHMWATVRGAVHSEGEFPRLSVNPSKKYPVSLVERHVFSLIPDPIWLTAKISHYTLLRALSTLFLCTVATSFFWILIITPWVCGALIWNIGGFREMIQWLTVLITKPDNLS